MTKPTIFERYSNLNNHINIIDIKQYIDHTYKIFVFYPRISLYYETTVKHHNFIDVLAYFALTYFHGLIAMKLNTLSAALLCALPMTGAFAAAMDRSGQSISSFLQPNNYAELGVSALMPDVSGVETDPDIGKNRKIDNMAKDYVFANAAVKLQLNDKFSFGLIFDQPFGASAAYGGDNFFVANGSDQVLAPNSITAMADKKINDTVSMLMSATTIPTQDADGNLLPPSVQQLAGLQQQVRATIGDVNSGGTLQALTLFANANLQGSLATAKAMYSNNSVLPNSGGITLKSVIDASVRQQVTAGVTSQVKATVNGQLGAINATTGGSGGNTKVTVRTDNLTMLFGVNPVQGVTLYAGPVYQVLKGNVKLRGQAYSIYNGYDADIESTDGIGWLAGAAYQIPEIALKASLTYRSEIDHKVNIDETIPTLGALALLPTFAYQEDGLARAAQIAAADKKSTLTTPQSVNLDLQSGIMANTVAFANIRWVNWQDFAIRPHQFGLLSNVVGQLPPINRPNGFNLVEYSEDQWSVTAGVGRKFNEKWAGNVAVGWDSGAGNPVSTLGPTEGYYNVGLGLQFSPAANYFVAGGVKYFWLGDAKAQTAAQAGSDASVANFEDNTAVAVGLKLGYRF